MSGRGMSDLGGKAGKGRANKRKEKEEADACESDAGQPARAKATRQTERTAIYDENLIQVLCNDKQKLRSTVEAHEQTIKRLREQLAAANAEKDNLQAGQQDLADRLANELTNYVVTVELSNN